MLTDAMSTLGVSNYGTQNCDRLFNLEIRPVLTDPAVFRFGTFTVVGDSPQFCGRLLSALSSASGHGRRERVLLDLPIEGAAADVEGLRRLFLVPADALQHVEDVGALGFPQRRKPVRFRGRGLCAGMQELDVIPANRPPRRGERSARHGALELADVAGPGGGAG